MSRTPPHSGLPPLCLLVGSSRVPSHSVLFLLAVLYGLAPLAVPLGLALAAPFGPAVPLGLALVSPHRDAPSPLIAVNLLATTQAAIRFSLRISQPHCCYSSAYMAEKQQHRVVEEDG